MIHCTYKKGLIARCNFIVVKTIVFLLLFFVLVIPQKAFAIPSEPLICNSGATCELGEFVYDDSYVPVTGATCTLKSWYPDGSIFVNSQPMPHEAEGWYAYDIVATGSAGLYRSQMCCTVSGETMCLDKSFKVQTATSTLTTGDVAGAVWNANKASYTTGGTFGSALQNAVPTANDVASSVWGYSGRTLSDFGTLVADVWSYSTRSLTTFGSLIADIWGNTTRTLSGNQLNDGSKLALQDDIKVGTQSAVAVLKGSSNKDLTDLYTDIASVKTDTGSIKTTVEATKTVVDSIFADTTSIKSTVTSILAKWGSTDAATIESKVDTVSTKLGTSVDAEGVASVFGRIEFLRNKWGSQTAQTVYDQAAAAASTISLVRTELDYNGKSSTAYQDLQRVIGYVDSLESSIGTSSDTSSTDTLFGKMKKVQDKVDLLTGIEADADNILSKWGSHNFTEVYDKVKSLEDKLAAISVTSITNLISQSTTNTTVVTELKNELLTVQAVSEVNRQLLEKTVNKPVVKTFLLEGSVIFKSLIYNPSQTETQTESFKYYLPLEVKKEDILTMDKELVLQFDTEKKQYYVSAEVSLAPSETKTFSVRVEDIWKVTDEHIASLRKQADELYKPLVKTSYFGQAVTIKSDIDVALDKIAQRQKDVTTPESKIQAYEDAKIELNGVNTKIDRLKELVGLASSAGSLLGFVGGAQAIAVWGLIIIISAGFIFLAIYMRTLRIQDFQLKQSTPVLEPKKPLKKGTPLRQGSAGQEGKKEEDDKPMLHEIKSAQEGPKLHVGRFVRLALLICLVSSAVSFGAGLGIYKMMSFSKDSKTIAKDVSSNKEQKVVLGAEKEALPEIKEKQGEQKLQETVNIIISQDTPVYLRSKPSSGSAILAEIKQPQEATVLEDESDFIKVRLSLDSPVKEGWINKSFVEAGGQEALLPSGSTPKIETARVIDSIGFLKVRQAPGGIEVGKVYPGEQYEIAALQDEWVEIYLSKTAKGWVSKKYIIIEKKISFATPHDR